ncbi:hypothetical protein QF25_15925 [Salmonella enterica subsp. enterica]|nr:hypothetical protein [Salmonella enterica subsp. enterica]EDW1097495.1 hypothetical protein [Salmonella enterica subsp. enterica]MIM34115.1 hypothetical protein [Salmonella enterica subsp. enterica]
MKKLVSVVVFALVASFSASSFAKWHGCQEQNLIFFAYNIKHTKAVELCQTEEGYRYTFGPIGKPEIILEKDSNDVTRGGGMAGGFDIKNGDIIYGVMEDKFGNSALIVQKSDYSRVMAEIELDSGDKNYVNKIHEYMH